MGKLAQTTFCFDLDGTITREELLPKIAFESGMSREIDELTDLTIQGLIPFEQSLRIRVEMLRLTPLSRIHRAIEGVKFFPKVLDFISTRADQCVIVTGNLDLWIKPLSVRLGVPIYSSMASYDPRKGTQLRRVIDKGEVLDSLRSKTNGKIVAIGDGFGDIGMLSRADVGVAFGGLHPPVIGLVEKATHVIYEERSLCKFLELQ